MSAELAFDDLYSSLKPSFVRIVVGKLGITRDEADDLYNPAWEKVWVQESQGTLVEDHLSYLVTTGVRDFLMDRRKHGVRAFDDGESALQSVDDLSDLVEDADMRRQIGLFAEAVQTLNPRYHEAVWLKYVHDYKPAEIVERTDLSERQVKRYIEAASKAMGPALRAIANGRWCEEQEVALLAYIRGETEPGDLLHAQAKRHLDNCPACRRRVRTQKGMAAALPAPFLLSATAAASAHGDGIFAGLRGSAAAVRETLLGLVTRTPVATNPELVGNGASTFTQLAKTAVAVCAAGAVCVPAAVVVSDSSLMPGHDTPKHAQAAKHKTTEKPLKTANASTTQPAPTASTAGLFAPSTASGPASSQTSGASTTSTTKPAGEFSLFNSFEQQAQEFSRQGSANFEKAAERSTFETSGSSSSKDTSGSSAKGDGSSKKKSSGGGGSADQEFGSGSFETAPAPTTSASTGTSSSATATAASTRALAAPVAPSAPAEFGGSTSKTSSGSFESGGGGFEGG